MTWQELIEELLRDFRISTLDLELKTGVSNSVISQLRTGKTKSPNAFTIKKLEDGLKIKINDKDLNRISYQKLESRFENIPVSHFPMNQFPLINHVGAGNLVPFDDSSTILIPFAYEGKDAIVLKVLGDSMAPLLTEGDYVLVDLNIKPEIGDIVAIRTKEGEQLIKVYFNRDSNSVYLYSVNPAYRILRLMIKEIEVIKKVVMHQRKFVTPYFERQ